MRKTIVGVGLIASALYVPAIMFFLGGVIFGADGMEKYGMIIGIWGAYCIGFILGLAADDVLDE